MSLHGRGFHQSLLISKQGDWKLRFLVAWLDAGIHDTQSLIISHAIMRIGLHKKGFLRCFAYLGMLED